MRSSPADKRSENLFRAALVVGLVAASGCGGVALPSGAGAEAPYGHVGQAATAQVGAWNSCYSLEGDAPDWTGSGSNVFCSEQWGSFPASCGPMNLDDPELGSGATHYAAGKRCSDIGRRVDDDPYVGAMVWTCRYGTFSNENDVESGSFAATTYNCSEDPSASNVSVTWDASTGNFEGSYTYSQAYGGPEGPPHFFWWWSPEGTQEGALLSGVGTVGYNQNLNINTLTSALAAHGYGNTGEIMFCVNTSLDTMFDDQNGSPYGAGDTWLEYANSTQCSAWITPTTWTGPAATTSTAAGNVTASVSGALALGSYQFNLGDDVMENNTRWDKNDSAFTWYRADDAKGTNAAEASSDLYTAHQAGSYINTKDYALETADNGKFVSFCVTEKGTNRTDSSTVTGTQTCSPYTSVGPLLELWADVYSGSNVNIAYKRSPSGTCFDLSDLSFGTLMTTFTLNATQNHDTTVLMYSDTGCSSSSYLSYTARANGTTSQQMSSSWNDQVNSVRVVWSDAPQASNVTSSLGWTSVTGSYTYSDTAGGLPESGSTFEFKRASDANGTGATVVQGPSTSTSYALTWADEGSDIQFCVKPANELDSGSWTCGNWVAVGPVVSLYQNQYENESGGTQLTFAYKNFGVSGDCIDLANYGFSDEVTSLVFNTGSAPATLTLYEWDGGVKCGSGGKEVSYSLSSGSSQWVDNIGSTWNDKTQYFKTTF